MRGSPRSIEEFLYRTLMNSEGFHRFVRRIYYKVNGLEKPMNGRPAAHVEQVFRPTKLQKFKAYRVLFWDEMRAVVGLNRRFNRHL
ncbi:LAQU0S05e05138g1_1 [Lachancea quebecensis]|uniref:LAQU0S05e05138g1_1 n=1 Tax=Lachancea quebecensis TaxID=1654605 RepID=A0A0P1KR37_9SACH|nr:LAQU0S05e05138g1_1 [Lachancea quebecensis]